mmetsp:Transcript_29806/g.39660  ORF Transcript_29806/g.39660 Transcript_29806/m.39660 type:complete len:85 (+) Transcript_29806:589-843(+)
MTKPAEVDLYTSTLKSVCAVLCSEGHFYIEQAIENGLLDRLHGVLLGVKKDDVASVTWALSNLACHSEQVSRILIQDDIFTTAA